MDRRPNVLRAGALALGAAVVLRLLGGGFLLPLWEALTGPETAAVLLYLESGRVTEEKLTYPVESPPPAVTEAPTQPPSGAAALPVFGAADVQRVDISSDISGEPDIEALMAQELDWSLDDGAPRVLIFHTHATECYTPLPGEKYELQPNYRTLDEDYNMISIGAEVGRLLEAAGIRVVHDRQVHDYPSFNSSYSNSREATRANLQENPTLRLVLDLHRDAADTPTGQMDTSAKVNGQESAQLMLVVGTDDGGLEHPQWRENLAMALKLQAQLEQLHPGLCRPLNLCTQRFNADLSPGALLIEVGAAGNTHEEAMVAARALAEGIIALARGANATSGSAS